MKKKRDLTPPNVIVTDKKLSKTPISWRNKDIEVVSGDQRRFSIGWDFSRFSSRQHRVERKRGERKIITIPTGDKNHVFFSSRSQPRRLWNVVAVCGAAQLSWQLTNPAEIHRRCSCRWYKCSTKCLLSVRTPGETFTSRSTLLLIHPPSSRQERLEKKMFG